MKRNTAFFFRVLPASCALCGFLPGCTPTEQQRAANTAEKSLDTAGDVAAKTLDKTTRVVSDVSITGTIKARYAATKGVPAASIDVTTKNGVVTLAGKVPSAYARSLAVQIAESSPGVKNVNNKIAVGK